MVANCDYVFIVTSLNHDFSFNRIARYVSTVLQTDAIPVVILTKSDLCDGPDGFADRVRELSDKVRVHAVSAIHGTGMDALKEYLTPGVTIALVGSSGAGKSTLVNTLAGKDIMRTSGIRESDSKGRHTTTSRKLFVLDHQVTVIDTPGMRELGMDQAQDGIDNTFDDIAELSTRCRFSDCRHESEPGCAIRKAIEEGILTQERYELYKSLHKENKNNYELKKQISKWNKQNKKRR
jgi:ribosome biogenesis GTPase